MLRIVRYLSKAEIVQMLIALVSIVGQIWFDLTLPDYMADITQLVETPGSEMSDIWIAGGKMLLVSLGSVACAVVTGFIAARVGASFSQRLRSLEFKKVENFGPAEMNRFSTASLITRSTNDITQIQMFVTMGLMMLVKAPIMAVWAVCKIANKGLEWTFATGIAVAVLLAVIGVIMSFVMPKFKAMQRLTDNINLVARENLTGLRVVRAYNAEEYQEDKFTEANKELTETQLFTNRSMAIMMPLMNTIMNGLMLAVYWIGAYLIDAAEALDKLTTFSNMVVFSSYSIQVIMSFLLLSMVFVLWPRADVSAQRVLEVIDTDPMVADGVKTAGKPGMEGEIEFRNVSFALPPIRVKLCWKASISQPRRAKRSRSLARPAPENRLSSTSCRAFMTRRKARFSSTALTCATTRSRRCVTRSAMCRSSRSCSKARLPAMSRTEIRNATTPT